MNQKRIILVTGSGGFLGTRVVSKLIESSNVKIRCLCRSNNSVKRITELKNHFKESNIEIIIGNLAIMADAEKAVQSVDIIIHCAAAIGGPLASMYFNTVIGTRNLLEAAKKNKELKRIVHVSSFAVYDTANLKRHSTIDENTPLVRYQDAKNDAYTYVKLKQELLIRQYEEKYKMPVVVVRPGVIYGPGGVEISRRIGVNLLGLFLDIGKKNLLPIVYVDNCADALISAGTAPNIEGEVINIHDDDLRTCNDFMSEYRNNVKRINCIKIPYFVFWLFSWMVEAYADYSKGQIPPVLSRYKAATNWKQHKFNNEKLSRILAWSQDVPTDEGLARHFRYFNEIHSGRLG